MGESENLEQLKNPDTRGISTHSQAVLWGTISFTQARLRTGQETRELPSMVHEHGRLLIAMGWEDRYKTPCTCLNPFLLWNNVLHHRRRGRKSSFTGIRQNPHLLKERGDVKTVLSWGRKENILSPRDSAWIQSREVCDHWHRDKKLSRFQEFP